MDPLSERRADADARRGVAATGWRGRVVEPLARGQRAFNDVGHKLVDALSQRVDAALGRAAEVERRQRERTARVRAERDDAAASSALDEVTRVASSDENLLPAMREALRAGCTVGEICAALRELWGTYDARHG
jgi:hypothetical protein